MSGRLILGIPSWHLSFRFSTISSALERWLILCFQFCIIEIKSGMEESSSYMKKLSDLKVKRVIRGRMLT